ncbi:MAG: DNA cytosine methyltransferase [Acidobacteria bacterium]|nr:DNA cytosine methyltransferase [Acidobacteriota bacterium]
MRRNGSKKPELTAISLFSGGGGLDLGLEAVGFSTLLATDKDEHSCITLNGGKASARKRKKPFLQHAVTLQTDICELEVDFLLQCVGCKSGEIDLLAGGPPCQAFSVFGKRLGRNDPRGLLAFDYLRILAGLRPNAFIFENVYGLLTIEQGQIFRELCERLSNPAKGLYYEISQHRLDAVSYGVPQFRDRIFLIGHIEGGTVSDIPKITAKETGTLYLPRWRTVSDAFRGLPPIGSSFPANHTGRVHSERIINRYAGLSYGERDPHTRINKLNPERPSFTIIVGSDKGGGKGHVHPTEPREVTPRESARIQTFPDWWAFSGTSRHPIRQIGNAVPPLLAAAIGNEIRSQIFGLEKKDFIEILHLLDQSHLFEEEGWSSGLALTPQYNEKLYSLAG